MADFAALTRACVAAPDDDVPRLVLADALEQAGDPIAELIRVQCQLQGPDVDLATAERKRLELREQELLSRYQRYWVPALPHVGTELQFGFRRGFIEWISGPLGELLPVQVELLERLPLLRAFAPAAEPAWKQRWMEFRISPLAARLEELDLGRWTDLEDLRTMAAAPNFEWLKHLHVRSDFGPTAAEVLSEGPWRNLQRLVLEASRLDEVGLRFVLRLRLTLLSAGGRTIDRFGAAALAEEGRRLEHLELTDTELGDEGAKAIAGGVALGRLKTLALARCRIGVAGVEALGASQQLASLVTLSLSDNPIGADGAWRLLEGDGLPRLRQLNLASTRLGNRGAEAVMLMTRARTLERLNLSDNGLTDESVAGLSRLGGLKALALNGNKLTRAGLTALQEALPQTVIYQGGPPKRR